MKRFIKVVILVILMVTLAGCKDKTQMILYDYSHKAVSDKPTNTDESDIKRILKSLKNN